MIDNLFFWALNRKQTVFTIPHKHYTTSVETALNSRCSSDIHRHQKSSHWGIFDRSQKLSNHCIQTIIKISCLNTIHLPACNIVAKGNKLTFFSKTGISEFHQQRAMVSSGMQQQAVSLLCSALGIGQVLLNLGKNGQYCYHQDLALVQMMISPMKPSYDELFWSVSSPYGKNGWIKGNLVDPNRNGTKPLIKVLSSARLNYQGDQRVSEKILGQLLWAARGRTPHYYNGKSWGLTIPTWGGRQNISSIYVIKNDKLFSYVNLIDNRPTNSLFFILELNKFDTFISSLNFSSKGTKIIIAANEKFLRAYWEIGYQLLNLILQASALDITYKVTFLTQDEKALLVKLGIDNPVILFQF